MMYRNLYWHKGVRGATAMIKKAVVSALNDGIITAEDLYCKDDSGFIGLCMAHCSYPPFSLVSNVERGKLEERKAWKAYEEDGDLEKRAASIRDRWKAEEAIYEALRPSYPGLHSYEVIIDIPEPISFETRIRIILPDGTPSSPGEDEMLFSKASSIFSKSLRKVALYLPGYVAEEDAEKAFREACRG